VLTTQEVIFITKGVQHIQVQAGTAYQLNTKDFNAKKSSLIAKKVGDECHNLFLGFYLHNLPF
jgi:DNA mismatch repair protein MutH